jgi:hypothetical protein
MIKKKKIAKFIFTNPKNVETLESYWEMIINSLRSRGGFTITANPREITIPIILAPELTETRQLYNVLENEDGWYTDGTYESTFITIDMQNFNFLPKRKTRRG